MARNRVIYQSQALFIAPSSTGLQVSGTTGPNIGEATQAATTPYELASGISLLKKLDRVQSCNFNFSINRQDINEFGKLARIDSIVMETPTVGLDFSYYVTDGYNERLMGFNVTGFKSDGTTFIDTNIANGAQAVSGLLSDLQGNNYYILTVDEGEDVVGGTLTPTSTVVGIGNGFISEYSFEAAVGSIPTASVTVEAFNIKCDSSEAPITVAGAVGTAAGSVTTLTGNSPAVDLFANPATKLTGNGKAYKIDYSRAFTNANVAALPGINFTGFTTGASSVSALRPGDIQLTLPSSEGLTNLSTAHIQSFSFTIPLSRTVLQRLGNTFGFARVIDVPINMDVTLNAIVAELRDENLFDILAQPVKQDFTIVLKDGANNRKIAYTIKGAILSSETYSENLGDNQSVDLTYTVQVGGANDTTAGVFMSGSYDQSLDYITSGYYKLGNAKV